MADPTQPAGGEYLYAIARTRGPADFAEPGIDGAPVRWLSAGTLAALISRTTRSRLRPERRNLSTHNAVLKWVMQDSSVLPVAFGVVATDEAALVRALRDHQAEIMAQLDRVEGKVEMGLRVMWEVPNLFEYFVNLRPELRAARDATVGDQQGPSRDEMIELGRLFTELLTEERDRHYERVAEVLGRHGVELKRNPTRNERDVLNLACLIPRAAQAEFEQAVTEAAAGFDASFTFDFNGPWAPHNFVELNLRL